ncbi:type I polyketide synthase [Streptomyces sp. NBC_00893]|uniref:type I polyketide synthase n=1 Tax=Streptomyces sp. NBC_00893 TaxID=2975862 RepID=UPI00225AAD3B|nr:type I polyketide synthase [Streptomyces sp. NBC_00893]MCX4849541.1 SDR family NAD(P)-dependent oxidoreductase [Streptomyces sp. NBC_00893]
MDANTAHDPADLIAVVGMAGKFPQAPDAESLWALLMDRGDAIGPVPADRWDTSAPLDPERDIQAVGGFLDGVDRFDAGFFGISPREAAAMDPQQRLMLEVGWRALEDAGRPAAGLAGTRTGVYVGASWHDYEILREARGARPTPHSLVGNALDVIAARLSYFLELRGPSMTVETGCSSSLVALHLAAQALRLGEVEAAIVGGVNLMADPHVTVGLTHFGGLSPDGRCKAFAADANGFVRGEGVAALYVKTLRRALADGDRIHGVVARTVVNNDGGGESLVTPSREGQEDLLRRAYTDRGQTVPRPSYIEAHGTGTGRGDPVEANAIGRILGADRTGDPLLIGSVKTNIGHLEAAAGMAGLFKLLLCLRHRVVPPSLHSEETNPAIDFDGLNLEVVREPRPLPQGPVTLGLNSFGWGGTNAHVVLTSPPETGPTKAPALPDTGLPVLVPLSARQASELPRRATDLLQAPPTADATEDGLRATAGTLAWRRDHFPHRAAALVTEPAELRTALTELAAGGAQSEAPGLVTGKALPVGRTAFVFPGQGSQWGAMGHELYARSPLFAEVVERCATALRPHVSWDPLDVFRAGTGDAWMSRIDMLQPALWAMSLGLAELWRAHGVEPDVVLGHSQGEITAATLAGVLSYEDAALVMARRSAIARRASGRGRMLAVDLDRDAALAALEGFEEVVSLAVHNGPNASVLSGDEDAVLMLKELLEADGTYCRLVNVDYASHSPQMDPLRADLLTELAPARPRAARIDLMSTVRVARLAGPEMDATYWADNLRSPVLFADSMTALFDERVTHVVEISPHPVLAPAIEQLAAERAEPVAVLTTLRRDRGGPGEVGQAIGRAYTCGLEPFAALPRDALVPLPGHPLSQDSHWTPDRGAATGAARGFEAPLEPAPGEPGIRQGSLELSVTDLPWLGDHQVYGTPVLPGTAMLTLAVNTARARTGAAPARIERVAFAKEVTLGERPARLTTRWQDDTPDTGTFSLFSLAEGAEAWETNATALIHRTAVERIRPAFPAWLDDTEPSSVDAFYRACADRGLEYGPAFRGVRTLYRHPTAPEAAGEVVLPERLRAANGNNVLHPALWDGALHIALSLYDDPVALVPTSVDRIDLTAGTAGPVTAVWSHAVRRDDGRCDVHLFGAEHAPLLVMRGLGLTPLPGADIQDPFDERLHRVEWTDITAAGTDSTDQAGRWTVCGNGRFADALTDALAAAGAETVRADTGDAVRAVAGDRPADAVVFVAPSAEDGPDAQRRGLYRLTELVRACTALPAPPALTILTDRAQAPTESGLPDPGAALYWGYSRVLRREHDELTPRIVDVDVTEPGWATLCAAALLTGDRAEDQTALRGGCLLAARLTRGPARDAAASALPAPTTGHQPFRVGPRTDGRGPGTAFLPLARRAPEPDEIEVEVTAAALDPGDTLKWAGRHQAATGRGDVLGGECAGRVVSVGGRVTELAVGDRVVACVPGALASHVTVRADHAQRIPQGLTDARACAQALVLAAGWYALVEVGRLDASETVLIHDAAAPAGLAAIQVARAFGARILATAATPQERAHLREAGIAEVYDSTDLSWADLARAATGGRGVDVVLNSLGGTALRAGLAVLAEDGRFLEAGRQDILAGRSIGLADFHKGISLSAVDVNGLVARHPGRFARILASTWEMLAAGKLDPLPVHTRPFAEVDAALEAMAVGGRIGREVVTAPATVGRITADPMPRGRFRADGTYLISGGLGALGLSLAEFLAERGAGALVLFGRSGPSPDAAQRVAALCAAGVRVETLRCDVADEQAVRTALDGVRAQLPPLRGVVHAAGLLDDATISTLTERQLTGVLAPKAAGARCLHRVTAEDPLDLFVLFSSAATLVGNAGQAAYAAGNASLDALAELRRRRGLPALSVQWGPFTDVGLAADDERRGARLAERGMGGFPTSEAWPALARLLKADEPVVGYVPIDPRQWFDANPDTAALASWSLLHAAARDAAPGRPGGDGAFRARLLDAPREGRVELAQDKVRELAGRVLRLDPDAVEPDSPFKALGLDSLMSLELRNRLEAAFGMKLSPTLLWAYGNTKALAGALCDQLAPTEESH